MKNCGIIGCGWLGFEFGKLLIENGYSVRGTTTNEANYSKFTQNAIEPFHFELGTPIEPTFFTDLDTILISLPISAHNDYKLYEDLADQIKKLKESSTNIILTSSTSAYHNLNETVTENDPHATNPESINFRFEELLRSYFGSQLTVMRLAGLIGEDRHPVVSLAGRSDISDGQAYVNLVHRQDVIQAIYSVIRTGTFGEIFNCVYPSHPSKRDYYTAEAKKRNLSEPHFLIGENSRKIVDGSKLSTQLGFEYKHSI